MSSIPPQDLSIPEFNRQLDKLSRQMENRTDSLGILGRSYSIAKVKKSSCRRYSGRRQLERSKLRMAHRSVHGMLAMQKAWISWSTPARRFFAAAGGVVSYLGPHPQYGSWSRSTTATIFTTRYAHCSRLLVKEGEVVQRGSKIARIRIYRAVPTGPHVHSKSVTGA